MDTLIQTLIDKFKDKAITPQVLAEIQAFLFVELSLKAQPSLDISQFRLDIVNSPDGYIHIRPTNIYTFVLLMGLELPPDNLHPQLQIWEGNKGIYKMKDDNTNCPTFYPFTALENIHLQLQFL